MAVVTTKSPSITNWDATPIFIGTTGEGVEGPLRIITDSVAAANGDTNGSTYRMVRIPTNAKVKAVAIGGTGITAGAADVDVSFSDSATDGTQPALAGGKVQITGPVDNKLFGSASTLVAATIGTRTLITFSNTFLFAHQNLPLWQVLVNLGATQFVADPGGFFDIVLFLTTSITTAGTLNMEVQYVE